MALTAPFGHHSLDEVIDLTKQHAAHEHVDVCLVVEEEVVRADHVADGTIRGGLNATVDETELGSHEARLASAVDSAEHLGRKPPPVW